jgi:hypothetical protein
MSYELCVFFAFPLRPTVGPTQSRCVKRIMLNEAMRYEKVYCMTRCADLLLVFFFRAFTL